MYMSREVFHCKPGRAKAIVAMFKKMGPLMAARGFPPVRIYTDVSAEQYWTVVLEQDVESIDGLAEMARSTMSDPEMEAIFKDYHEHVIGGRRELYKVE